jgi:wyosine [tRNA(Phe)-imidazoG37] synthetase (radical SAM superfamily)
MDLAYGPVPSRRLGRSLGINNIPPKICTYACTYCQLGRTIKMQVDRQAFYSPEKIVEAVRLRVASALASGDAIDYLTYVPDGEPTLDSNLAAEIAALRYLQIPLAVISNASLVWRQDVRDDLMGADWVSLKVDAANTHTWRDINRPHGQLDLHKILDGISRFAEDFEGRFVTETMLIEGVNDDDPSLFEIARILAKAQPSVAYIAVPTRPPAESYVRAASEERIHRAFQLLSERVDRVELLLGYEGNAFASSGNPQLDLLSITAVHPMRRDAVEQLVRRGGASWDLVETLMQQEKLVELAYEGRHFYLRRIASPKSTC